MSVSFLLTTKLSLPTTRKTLVPRASLHALLDTGIQARVTLLSASAGFGKTTLVSNWLQEQPVVAAWVSLDEGDNDPTLFWSYSIAAIQKQLPYVGQTALMMVQASSPPPVEKIITVFINDIANLSQPVVLVLDDYHVIEAPEIHRSLQFFIEHLPQHVHLFLISRVDPPLSLARLRVNEQVVEIRDNDLRFTESEVATFLTQIMGLPLSQQQIQALDTHTEGWIAGLQLAAVSMKGQSNLSSFIAGFTGSHRFIFDYLMDEVLQRQPLHIQKFLLHTSILKRFTADTCLAVTGEQSSQQVLEYLERHNLFLVPLDNRRTWYRYHALFADALQTRLHILQPQTVKELHHKASQWFEQQGFFPEAISHAFLGQDAVRAAQLIERTTDTLWMHGEMTTLLTWLQKLPDEVMQRHPRLLLIYAWVHFLHTHKDTHLSYLHRAEQALQTQPLPPSEQQQELQGILAAIYSTLTAMQEKSEQALFYAQRALQLLPQENLIWRVIPTMNIALASLHAGKVLQAETAFKKAMHLAEQVHNHYVLVTAISCLGIVQGIRAELRQAEHHYLRARELAGSQGEQLPNAGYISVGLGQIYYERNQREQALIYIQAGIEHGRRWRKEVLLNGYIALAQLQHSQGKTLEALHTIQLAEEVNATAEDVFLDGMVATAYKVRLWLAQGNIAAATAWAEQQIVSLEDLNYQREIVYMALARVYLAQNKPEQALTLLQKLQPLAETEGRIRSVLENMVLQALASQALKKPAQAAGILQKALQRAEPEGYIRLFVDEGEGIHRLLQHLLHTIQGKEPYFASLRRYIHTLLQAMEQPEKGQRPPTEAEKEIQPLIEPLSTRELEVLRMLVQGASNQTIAETLVISLPTVKKHVGNILGKLGVSSRTQAIIRARELHLPGLLDSL